MMRVIIIAPATHVAGNPITWLKKSRRTELSVASCTPKAIEPTPYNMLVLRVRGGRFAADSDVIKSASPAWVLGIIIADVKVCRHRKSSELTRTQELQMPYALATGRRIHGVTTSFRTVV